MILIGWCVNLKQKLSEKQSKIIKHLCHQKNFVCVCMYKMDTFALFTATKNGVEAIEYGGEIWINQGHLLTNVKK